MSLPGKTIAYLIVSTIDQDLDKNRSKILHLANEKGLGQVKFIEEKVSGKISWHNRKIIASLKLRTTNTKNRNLLTKECLRLLETFGIETADGLIKSPPGLLKKSIVSLYLKRFGLDRNSLLIQSVVV
jgi:hypothetical protein